MSKAIEFENIGKQYRLGLVSTRTLSHDLNRWWTVNVRGKEDPYLKIGDTNDRAHKGESDYVWALKDINFKVEQGDVVGIIGKNGAGKSTLLKLLSRVTAPTTGQIRARGRIGSLLEVGTGFHQEMTGRENIFMNGAILGMSKQEISSKLDEIVDFSGCERYLDTPVKRYSSGMMVRLGFAVAAHLDPEILVVDEVLAVGDAEFQKKAIGKMKDVSQGEGRTVLFVSHNMASIRALCKRGLLLENGMIRSCGRIEDVVSLYLNDNMGEECETLDTVNYHQNSIRISRFSINGSNNNDVALKTGQNTIQVSIDGESSLSQVIEFEAQLYDEKRTLLASYLPCHSEGRSLFFAAGHFQIKEKIVLPQNVTGGVYLLDIQLSHPNVEYLVTLNTPIRIHIEGIQTASGNRLDYNRSGFLVL